MGTSLWHFLIPTNSSFCWHATQLVCALSITATYAIRLFLLLRLRPFWPIRKLTDGPMMMRWRTCLCPGMHAAGI